MFKFVIFAVSIVLTSAGIIPSEHHYGLHQSISLPSGHGAFIEQPDHYAHSHHLGSPHNHLTQVAQLSHGSHLAHGGHLVSPHGQIVKLTSPHQNHIISHHTPIAITAPIKVSSPIIKYVAQPIVKVQSHEPILLKSYIPHGHLQQSQHQHIVPSYEHIHKVAIKVAPLPHHHHPHHHAISVPAYHTSPIVLTAPGLHHATLPLASHHGHHLHHHELLH